jgi:hypothetical protein
MTSPGARQRRRRQQYQTPRTRAELAAAVGAAVAIVAGTALMIWLLRPGGLADRQPRSSWLVGIVLIASAVLLFQVLRPKTPVKKLSRQVSLGGGFGIIAVLAVVAGFAWPHGLIRHTPVASQFPTVPTANPLTSTSAIVAPSSTAIPGATTPGATTAPGGTTAPTAAPGATGSSGATQTTTANQSTTSGSPPPVSPSP